MKIKILNSIFKVEWINVVENGIMKQTNIGEVNHDSETMQIVGTLSGNTIISTIIHEIIHVLCKKLGIDLSEKDTCLLEMGIHSVLKDNPILFSVSCGSNLDIF